MDMGSLLGTILITIAASSMPWGFVPSEARTSAGNAFAIRTAFILHLAASYGTLVSAEQPAGSVMYRLDVFQRLLLRRYYVLGFCFCTFGTSFQQAASREMADGCSCPLKGKHLRLESALQIRLHYSVWAHSSSGRTLSPKA